MKIATRSFVLIRVSSIEENTGHVVVFDTIINGNIRIVDPGREQKWRLVESDVLFESIKQHGDDNGGGIWRLDFVK